VNPLTELCQLFFTLALDLWNVFSWGILSAA
jgi:hypothetical protein